MIKKKQKPTSKVIVVGFDLIGREISKLLKDSDFAPTVIEQKTYTALRREERDTIFFGDATEPNILKEAHIEEASHLIITTSNTSKSIKIIQAARHANPNIQIVARIRHITEKPLMDELNVKYICTESEELEAFTALLMQLLKPIKYL